MKMLNRFKIDKKIQKVLETPEGYVMNGHYYRKDTMSPKALELFPAYGDPEDLALNKRVSVVNANIGASMKAEDIIIIDNIDPTISYTFTQGIRSNTVTVIKTKEQNGSSQILNELTVTGFPAANSHVAECLGQSNDFIYLNFEQNTSNGNAFFCRLEKATLALTNLKNEGTYSTIKKVYEDENFIYATVQKQYGALTAVRIDKATGVLDNVKITGTAGNIAFTATGSTGFEKDGKIVFYTLQHQQSPSAFYLMMHELDPANVDLSKCCTSTRVNITWDSEVSALPLTLTHAYQCRYELKVTTVNDKAYLHVISVALGNFSGANNQKVHGIHTYEIGQDSSSELTYKGKTEELPHHLRGVLMFRDNTYAVALTSVTVYFYAFNKTLGKFELTRQIACSPHSIGVDLQENVWVTRGNYEVEMFSPFTPSDVNIVFEKDSYSYEGTEITSFISVEALNYDGENIEANLELTLKGSAVFASTGNKIIAETTSLSGTKNIPIKVTGPGSLSVYTKVIV